jgi:hypothetical protein
MASRGQGRLGHAFNVVNNGGAIIFYDAQRGIVDMFNIFSDPSYQEFLFLRTDDSSIYR